MRGRESNPWQLFLSRRGAESVCPSAPPPHARHGTMKLEPLISPTPSTGTGGAEVRSRCAHRSSTRAGPCDAVIDVVRSRRLESGAWLLLLPTLGLPRALLRRRFRLRLSLLRHAALLAVSEWRCRISARGDREHCIRITTARQKNQCFRSMQHVRARADTRCCAYPSTSPARERPRGVTAANRDPNSSELVENIDEIWVFGKADHSAPTSRKARTAIPVRPRMRALTVC